MRDHDHNQNEIVRVEPMWGDVTARYEAIVDGDPAAFDHLYEEYKGLVWWVIRNAGVSGADAEDIFQTTWATFFDYLGRHRNPHAIKSWLATVARNQCINLGRVSGRTVPIETLLECESDDVPPDAEALQHLDIEALEDALQDLTERERQLITLWAHGVSYHEIDLAIGIPAGSVGPTVARCRAKLAATMKERS